VVQDAAARPQLRAVNGWEADFLWDEVPSYLDHGIRLAPGATVLDVGANIGVFSAYVWQRLGGDVRILAFEPVPPIHALLARNAAEVLGDRVTPLPYGLSAADGEIEITYFPGATLLSSSRRGAGNLEQEQERAAAALFEGIKEDGARRHPVLRRMPGFVLRPLIRAGMRRLRSMETYRVQVRSLSRVLQDLSVDHVDLLKIDVEGAEFDVLAGIDDADWPRIRQVVIEVERWGAHEPAIRDILAGRGFAVHAERASVAGDIGLVYGMRDSGSGDRASA
jgi:FkbM family methyltransferase